MTEPITIEEIVQHLDIVREDQDEMLLGHAAAAREWVEGYTGFAIDGDEVTQMFPSFDRLTYLRVWPETDAVRIDYLDAAGEPVQVTTARLWRVTKPARVMPPLGEKWPIGIAGPIAVTVTGVPFSLKAAMLLLIGNLYANRGTSVIGSSVGDTGTVEDLCRPYRLPVIG